MSSIQDLSDERSIHKGLATFARILDRRDWLNLSEVFATDVTFDYGSGETMSGIATLEQMMRGFLDPCGPTQHLIGSMTVDIDGDLAVSSAYVQARHQKPADPAGAIFDTSGEYVDRWARLPQGWRIVHRHAIWLMHAGDPAVLYPAPPPG